MPRSLFLKIFLWFGAAMLTMILTTFLVGEFIRHEPFRLPLGEEPEFVLASYAQTAAEIYKRDGQPSLAGYLAQIERGTNMRSVLYGPNLNELSGRDVPDGALELASKATQTRKTEFVRNRLFPLLARPVQTVGGDQYVWVAEMPPHPPLRLHHQLLHVIGMSLIGAAFCYWLAKYLTAPVTKLRQATKELAGGNLATRVGPSLGKRRDELVSLGSDFDLMAEQIELLLKAQRRLLGDISHELRSPLARLNVALELARQRAGSEATSALTRIQHEAENLNALIGQLLALTRLETGTREISKNRFDLVRLVREIADDADFEARSRNRSVRVSSSESCMILASEELLRPAIENVVRNAVQYTAEGTEVEIEIKAGSSRDARSTGLALNLGDGVAEITVRDHGPGVPENALAEIFRSFYRVDDARDRESGGTGLGLAITERAVRLHGGTVTATNASDTGLIVTITLPVG
ncbi:MAG: ATP-binding protein [Pyrinomonadaceae bacterium]|nr:ATP-binding protein [Pyrinomonadaceae bacterium]